VGRRNREESRAGHQARNDMFGPKIGGKRPQASKSPFSTQDRLKGAALTSKVMKRAKKQK
jgi:hypothetical protein